MRQRIVAAAVCALLVAGICAGIGGVLLAGPAGAQSGPPSAEPATDLRSDKLDGPFLDDSDPGRGAAIPMAVAGVVIFGIVVGLVVKSRRRAHEPSGQGA